MARDSVMLDADTVDSNAAPWLDLAQQLKQDLASIILMSEADLQVPTHSNLLPCITQNATSLFSHFIERQELAVYFKLCS